MEDRSRLWQISALQVMTFAARGLMLPFANLYLTSVGFNNAQIGTIISITALVQLLVTPVLNHLADRHGRHRWLYYGLNVVSVVSLFGFTMPLSSLWLEATLLVRTISDNSAATLLAQLSVTWLTQRGKAIFGRVRVWGSFGYGLTTLAAGTIFARGGYSLLFILSGAITAATLFLIHALPARTAEKPAPQVQAVKSARGMNFYLLAASVFLFYIGSSAFSGFSFIYYQKELGADNGLIGLVTSLSAWSEIPAMLLIDWLIRRWNVRRLLIIGTAGLSIIWLLLSTLHGTSLLLPILLMRGTFFACQIVSITLLVAEISPPPIVATNQALIQVTVPGVATLLTGLASGWMFDQFGGRVLFQTIGILGLASALLLVLVRRRLMPYRPPADLAPLPGPEVA